MKIRKTIIYTILFLLFILSFIIFKALARFGQFSTLKSQFDGTCKIILDDKFSGAEDIILVNNFAYTGRDYIFISTFDRISARANDKILGKILIAPIDDIANLKEISLPQDFKPVGIGVLNGQKPQIMAVNNAGSQSKIEIFNIDKNMNLLSHNSIIAPDLHRLNDVVPIGENQFYVSNESKYSFWSPSNVILNLLGNEKSGSIHFYDGKNLNQLASGLSFANSLALSQDGKKLYASSTMDQSLRIYDTNGVGMAKESEKIFLGTGADNITIDDEGRIFIASHPRLAKLIGKMAGVDLQTPSQLIVLEPSKTGKGGLIDQVYLKDNDIEFGATSVGIKYKNQIIMGSIFAKGLRQCELPQIWHQSQSHPARKLIDIDRDAEAKLARKKLMNGEAK